jgi:hypothetical protein
MAHSSKIQAELLAISWSLIDESRRLLAIVRGYPQDMDAALLTSSRERIAESRRLLARLTAETAVPMEATAPHRSAALSVRVFQEGSRFKWTLNTPSHESLGRGMAETEFRARVDAFQAGMTYIDRAKGRTSPSGGSLH